MYIFFIKYIFPYIFLLTNKKMILFAVNTQKLGHCKFEAFVENKFCYLHTKRIERTNS